MIKKKAKPRGVPFKKGYDERRSLVGAPKRGESYAETFDKAFNMTPADALQLVGRDNDLGRMFVDMPQDVPFKVLLALRNISAEMFEPSAGRMSMLIERVEGKVTDKLDLSNADGTLKPETMKPSEIAERVAALLKVKDANGS